MLTVNDLSSPSSLHRNKEERLQLAKRGYDAAAANKDKDPETFELARFQYLSLKNGPVWARQEKMRMERDKLAPIVNTWRSEFMKLQEEEENQSSFMGILQNMKDKQGSIRTQADAHAHAVQEEVQEKQDKTAVYNRLLEASSGSFVSSTGDALSRWFAKLPSNTTLILDIVLGVIGLIVVVFLVRRFYRPVVEIVQEAAAAVPPPPQFETAFEIKPIVRQVQ
jgi:hypothetical protein